MTGRRDPCKAERTRRLKFERSEVYRFIQTTLSAQNGRCAICNRLFAPSLPYEVDHDHSCCTSGCRNCWRGLLCRRCNTGIGFFGDSIRVLASAIVYLQDYVSRSKTDYRSQEYERKAESHDLDNLNLRTSPVPPTLEKSSPGGPVRVRSSTERYALWNVLFL